jgi:nucleoid DNA-binding protein
MNKGDLTKKIAHLTGLTQKDARRVTDVIIQKIIDGLAKGERLELRGLGAFEVRRRAPRVGRVIETGERVPVPERKVPVFIPGKILKKLVNK